MNKVSLFIRKLTVPPMFALLFLILLYIVHPEYYGGIGQFAGGIFALVVLPLSAYPIQKYIPPFKDRGREGQRSLAMIFSFIGYLAGTLMAFVTSAPAELKIVYLEYLFCGAAILLFNKVFHLKASGHACGISGPVFLLAYFKLYIPAVVGAAMIVPVYVSSLKTQRHTVGQLAGGSMIAAAVLGIVHLIM